MHGGESARRWKEIAFGHRAYSRPGNRLDAPGGASSLGLFFCKVGALTFGGGSTMIALIQEQMVHQFHNPFPPGGGRWGWGGEQMIGSRHTEHAGRRCLSCDPVP